MAADPTLADRLDAFGDKRTDADAVLQLGRVQPEPFRSYLMMVARDLDEGQRLARAAAVRLRKLDAAIESAVREIRGTHYQDPLIRTLCVVCGAADGSYPCSALVDADALADALGGTE